MIYIVIITSIETLMSLFIVDLSYLKNTIVSSNIFLLHYIKQILVVEK